MILGVDGGNNAVKIFGEDGPLEFPSSIGEYRELKLLNNLGDNDMICEFKGRKFFSGSLAQYESEFSSSMIGDSKAHEEFLIRILIGLHKYTDKTTDFYIVVGQPISKHTDTEKNKMIQMIKGSHEITVNRITKKINIHDVRICAEGGAAFWSAQRKGKVHILDFGSGTVNCATLIDGKYIDRDSFTIKQGLNTITSNDLSSFSRSVCIQALKKWDCDDIVLLVGGGAEQMLIHIFEYFRNVQLLKPKVNVPVTNSKALSSDSNLTEVIYLHPVFANCVGFYNIGKKAFANV